MLKQGGVVLLGILLAAAGIVNAQKAYDLKYKPVPGISYYFTGKGNAQAYQNIQGQERDIVSSNYIRYKIMVDKLGENYSAIITFDSLFSKTAAAEAEIVDNGELEKGKSLNLIFTSSGNKIESKEIDKITGLRNFSSHMFIRLPENPIKPGDKWFFQDKDSSNNRFVTLSNTNYKFEGIEKKNGIECAKISFNSTSDSKIEGKDNNLYVVRKGKITSEGIIYFDIEKGMILEFGEKSNGVFTVNISDYGIEFPMTTKVNHSWTMSENK